MQNFTRPLKIVTALLAVITAGLLAAWVFGVIDSEAVKDTVLKLALVSAIAVALSVILQLLSDSDKK